MGGSLGQADMPMRAGSMASDRIGVRDVGETKMPARGYLRALYVDGQGMSQGGQVCQSENGRGFNAFTTGWLPKVGLWSKWLPWLPLGGFLTKTVKSTLRVSVLIKLFFPPNFDLL
jgi:hypothetical protein